MAGWLTNWLYCLGTDQLTKWFMAGWLTNWLYCPRTDQLTEWFQAYWIVRELVKWLNVLWLIDRLTDWMIYGWLTDWLTYWIRVYIGNALSHWNTIWLTVFVWGLRSWLNDATLTLELIRLTRLLAMHNLNENISSVWIEHNQNTIARDDYTPHGPNFMTILAFLKNWPLLRQKSGLL